MNITKSRGLQARSLRGAGLRCNIPVVLIVIQVFAVIPGIAVATETESAPPPTNTASAKIQAGNQSPQYSVSVSSDFVGSGNTKYSGATPGHSDAFAQSLEAKMRLALNDQWFGTLRVDSENIWFHPVTGAPVPGDIHYLSFQPGLGYIFNEQWVFSASAGPELYSLQNVYGGDMGVAGVAVSQYEMNKNLRGILGVAFDSRGEYPVLPVGGVDWTIQPNLDLDLVMPRPTVIYRLSDSFSVLAGGELTFVTFRSSHDLSERTGVPGYDNALGSYRNIQFGGGVKYQYLRRLSLSVQGGYSVGRQIRFLDSGSTVKFGSAPCVQATVEFAF